MPPDQREKLLIQARELFREHCSSVVITAAFLSDDPTDDDTMTATYLGGLFAAVGTSEYTRLWLRDKLKTRLRAEDEEETE